MIRVLPILVLLGIYFGYVSAHSAPLHQSVAFEKWIGSPLRSSTIEGSNNFSDFKELSAVAAHLALNHSLSGWRIREIHNYNDAGEPVMPAFLNLPTNQLRPEGERVLISGYYFISKNVDGREVNAIVYVGGSTFCVRQIRISYSNQDEIHAQELKEEFASYLTSKNIYKNSVIQGVEDEWGNTCFTYLENVSDFNYSWDDFILEEPLKSVLYGNTIQFVENFPTYLQMNKKVKRGALLYGPPGTGKSFVGQVLISKILHGDLQGKSSMVVVTARHLRHSGLVGQIFRVAQAVSPTTVFMEDIDLLGIQSRDSSSSAGTARDKEVLNEFLNGMDGLVDASASLFIGTTNKVENVDSALVRSGRLGLHYYFPLPGYFERSEFFKKFVTKHAELGGDVTYEWLAAMTEGLSGADIVEIISLARQTALLANAWAREGVLLLSKVYLEEAIDRVRHNDVGTYEGGVENMFQPLNSFLNPL